jgi:hypothetical protein
LRIRLTALAATLLAAACVDQTPFTPTTSSVIVHAVLDVTARDQYVIVQSTSGTLITQRAIASASVSIITPDGRQLIADEVRDSTQFGVAGGVPLANPVYRVSLDRYGANLVAGGTYALRITLPDGRKVSGVTTIPPVAPSFSTQTDTLDRQGALSIAWTRTAGVKAYELFVSPSAAKRGLFADTSVVLTRESRIGSQVMFVSGSTATVLVNAVDDNYYDYLRRASDPYTANGVINRLEGAVGVFGSVVRVARRTVVLP